MAETQIETPDRYLGYGTSFVKIGAPHRYKIGDQVFFSTANHTAAGEGMFICRLKESPEILWQDSRGDTK